MHMRWGEVRWGSEIMCVCCKSHFPPFKQRGEYVCNVCIFSVLQKKKKLKENGKVYSQWALSSQAVYAVILLTV